MLSTRQIILSQDEVCEAIREFVRLKYHEKIEKGYKLTSIQVSPQTNAGTTSVSFLYEETLSPFVKSSHGKS